MYLFITGADCRTSVILYFCVYNYKSYLELKQKGNEPFGRIAYTAGFQVKISIAGH